MIYSTLLVFEYSKDLLFFFKIDRSTGIIVIPSPPCVGFVQLHLGSSLKC